MVGPYKKTVLFVLVTELLHVRGAFMEGVATIRMLSAATVKQEYFIKDCNCFCSLGKITIPDLFETLSSSGFRGGGVNVQSNTGALPETATLAFESWTNITSSEEIVTADFEEIGCGWTLCDTDEFTYWACIYGTPEDPSEIPATPPSSMSVESMLSAEAPVSLSTVSEEDLASSMVAEDSDTDGACPLFCYQIFFVLDAETSF